MSCMLNTETKTHEKKNPGSAKYLLQDILASISEALTKAARRRDTEVAARTASKIKAAIGSRNTTGLKQSFKTALVSDTEMAGTTDEIERLFTFSGDLDVYRRRPRAEPRIKDPVNVVSAQTVESNPMRKIPGTLSLDEESSFAERMRILSGLLANTDTTRTAPTIMPSGRVGCDLLENMRAELGLSPSQPGASASAIPQDGKYPSGSRDVLAELNVNTVTSKSAAHRVPPAASPDRSELDRILIELGINTQTPVKTEDPVIPKVDTHDSELARIRAELGINTETTEKTERPVIPKANNEDSELTRILVELGINTKTAEKAENPVNTKADTHDFELARMRAELGINASSQNIVKHAVVFKDPGELLRALNELHAGSNNDSALQSMNVIGANDDHPENTSKDHPAEGKELGRRNVDLIAKTSISGHNWQQMFDHPLFSDSSAGKYETVGTHKNHLYTFIVNNKLGHQAQATPDKKYPQVGSGPHHQHRASDATKPKVDERGQEHRGLPVQRKAEDKRLANRVFISNIAADANERDIRMAFFDFGLKKGAVKILPIRNAANRTQMAYMDLASREDAIIAAEKCRFIFGLMVHIKLGMEDEKC